MTLPLPPDSFFEGGEPQSVVAPGDTGRELVHDVRNLTQAVDLLRAVVAKQRLRQRQIIVFALLTLTVLFVAVGYTRYLAVNQSQDRIRVGHTACEQDRARGSVEIEILSATLAANQGDPRAAAFFGPRIAKLKALQKDCDALYPSPRGKGWPTFWSVG